MREYIFGPNGYGSFERVGPIVASDGLYYQQFTISRNLDDPGESLAEWYNGTVPRAFRTAGTEEGLQRVIVRNVDANGKTLIAIEVHDAYPVAYTGHLFGKAADGVGTETITLEYKRADVWTKCFDKMA